MRLYYLPDGGFNTGGGLRLAWTVSRVRVCLHSVAVRGFVLAVRGEVEVKEHGVGGSRVLLCVLRCSRWIPHCIARQVTVK